MKTEIPIQSHYIGDEPVTTLSANGLEQNPEGFALAHRLPIFLVGMMGAGKTTVGRSLARLTGRDFIDLDHELEARCGVRIPVIFEIEGESGFRRRESVVLDECTRQQNTILATGGGAVLSAQNRLWLQQRGIVLYLRANVDELFRRTSRDRNRPLLANSDPYATLLRLVEQREPLYNEVADIVVETGVNAVDELVGRLLELLGQYDPSHKGRE